MRSPGSLWTVPSIEAVSVRGSLVTLDDRKYNLKCENQIDQKINQFKKTGYGKATIDLCKFGKVNFEIFNSALNFWRTCKDDRRNQILDRNDPYSDHNTLDWKF